MWDRGRHRELQAVPGTAGTEDTCEKTAEVLGNGGLSDCEGLSCHAQQWGIYCQRWEDMGRWALVKSHFLAGTCGVDKTSERARDYRHWTSQANRNRREGGRAPLREWPSHRRYDKNWLEPTKSKMAEDSTSSGPWTSLYAHCNVSALQIVNIC